MSRWADVTRALGDPRLEPPGGTDPAARPAAAGVTPAHLAALEPPLRNSACRFARDLPAGPAVDLVRAFAEPWALEAALAWAGLPLSAADAVRTPALRVFEAAARATGAASDDRRSGDVAELARALRGRANVQAFVALAGTLAALLGSAWHALAEAPDEWSRLPGAAARSDRPWDELLRYAGPARAVFRTARAPVEFGPVRIPEGGRVALMLASANRDPDRFADPHRLDLARDASAHLGFGRGRHGCPGSALVRSALAVATSALRKRTPRLELAGDVVRGGGFAIAWVAALPVVLD